MAALSLGGLWGYDALTEYRGDTRLDLMFLAISVFFLFVRPPTSVEERDPDVRFGTFLGTLVGGIGAFLLRVVLYR